MVNFPDNNTHKQFTSYTRDWNGK